MPAPRCYMSSLSDVTFGRLPGVHTTPVRGRQGGLDVYAVSHAVPWSARHLLTSPRNRLHWESVPEQASLRAAGKRPPLSVVSEFGGISVRITGPSSGAFRCWYIPITTRFWTPRDCDIPITDPRYCYIPITGRFRASPCCYRNPSK